MKTFILSIFLSLNLLALEKLNIETPSLSKDTRVLLESISEYAIKIGNGSAAKIYVFVDPMCPYSQKYLKQITQNTKALEKNTYYVFLYKLDKFDSKKLTQYILQSSDKADTLQKVMIMHEKVDLDKFTINEKIQEQVKRISKAAKKIDIAFRPYIIEFEKGSRYCTSSAENLPCLEENDF